MPSFRRMAAAIAQELVGVDDGIRVDGEAEQATCARHFMSSVGAETMNVARPPAAPASQILERFWEGEEGVEAESRRDRVRL